jgi:hypothetical protein
VNRGLLLAALLLAGDAAPPSARDAAASPFACPPGTERMGAAPPQGFEVWCERPDQPSARRREGPARTWYDDGGLAKANAFKAGLPHGPYAEWHRNGRPARTGAYVDGERDGVFTVWSEAGVKEEECGYARGARDGRFATWWPNGRRRVEGRFCHDLQCGTWTTWDQDGRELGRARYEEIRGTP